MHVGILERPLAWDQQTGPRAIYIQRSDLMFSHALELSEFCTFNENFLDT